MPTIEHEALTGAELHEPKGISTASSGNVYVANGTGSGVWTDLWSRWGWNIDSSATTGTILTASTATVLTNDAAGAAYLDFGLSGTTDPWDPSDNSFDFSDAGLEVGDDFNLRIDLTYTVDTTNDGFLLEMHYADGEAEEIVVPIADENVDLSGSKRFIINFQGFVGNSDVLNNPARLYITADSSGDSVLLNGFKFTALPRKARPVP